MSAAGWESLPPCPRLTKIATSQRVGVAGLQRIVEQCPELRDLWIDDETIPDLNPLARLTRLRRLQTHANSLDGDWVDMLLNMPVFEDLFVDNPIAVDLEQLPELAPKLKRFGFRAYGGTRLVTSEKWAPITEMPGLLDLTIAGDVAVDGPGLRRIAAMPDLRRVVARGCGQVPQLHAGRRGCVSEAAAGCGTAHQWAELPRAGRLTGEV